MIYRPLFGVSTLALRGSSIDAAISNVEQAGFQAFELVPYVWKTTSEFTSRERKDIASRLAGFSCATVHSSGAAGANLQSSDETVRRKSWDEYVGLLQLGADVGARVATFHHVTLEFAEHATTFGDRNGIKIGIETFDQALLDSFDLDSLGSLFDVGHATLAIGDDLEPSLSEWIDSRRETIVQFHFHGVIKQEGELIDHYPIDDANIIDYVAICRKLTAWNYMGPLIFEIGIRDQAADDNLRACAEAKDLLIASIA